MGSSARHGNLIGHRLVVCARATVACGRFHVVILAFPCVSASILGIEGAEGGWRCSGLPILVQDMRDCGVEVQDGCGGSGVRRGRNESLYVWSEREEGSEGVAEVDVEVKKG